MIAWEIFSIRVRYVNDLQPFLADAGSFYFVTSLVGFRSRHKYSQDEIVFMCFHCYPTGYWCEIDK